MPISRGGTAGSKTTGPGLPNDTGSRIGFSFGAAETELEGGVAGSGFACSAGACFCVSFREQERNAKARTAADGSVRMDIRRTYDGALAFARSFSLEPRADFF